MPSCPTEDLLVRIAASYRSAIGYLEADDLAAVGAILDEVDALLPRVAHPTGDDDARRAARATATREHAALVAAIGADVQRTQAMLAHTRRGQRALTGYGQREDIVGSRVERDA